MRGSIPAYYIYCCFYLVSIDERWFNVYKFFSKKKLKAGRSRKIKLNEEIHYVI